MYVCKDIFKKDLYFRSTQCTSIYLLLVSYFSGIRILLGVCLHTQHTAITMKLYFILSDCSYIVSRCRVFLRPDIKMVYSHIYGHNNDTKKGKKKLYFIHLIKGSLFGLAWC